MSSPPHFLLVEDEPAIRYVLQATLEFGGFSSDTASTALESLELFRERKYDGILLDLGLPDLDGLHLLEAIRDKTAVPIVVISGSFQEQLKIKTLDLGADDFVEKPFYPGELLARIRALLRRSPARAQASASQIVKKSEARFDPVPLRLTPLEKRLVDRLESRTGEVVSNEELAAAIWGREDREAGHLRVLITQLRRKLLRHQGAAQISNARGRGYFIEAARAAN